ncbi:MAG: hypothetical protein A3C22_02095 [Candidatus Levybacteria bacterium RIFCSPHIGHO2_02_FULL_37_10]|uniref:DUF11 domain-containing protein n=1 Tax=candidate division WWE3 bacterium RIFCSPHIGHO2_01_FULL_35_17 TaxID=1802614 RepID=A0A1F4UQX2_UNCKA|nr:MAG: hypothetical protein A2713_00045 [candidate division WWE3 bacterium RIFCSPHIGHO2_01_FULL_35_17]OGH17200.1 MAG: hypothetical protein A3C22_02095 [Candidatus Levybacteria bacterium RIFCSPHIGHO2_02_FULL_37_10]
MGRNIKTLLILTIAVFQFSILNFQFSKKAFAAVSCQPIYGGGETCASSSDISIDKKVLNPQTNKLADNLGTNDPKYKPDFIANFQIKITNTGDSALSRVDIKDIFPQYVAFSAGPGGFDSNTKTLSFSISNLNPNETKTFNILGRIAAKDQLPQGIICVVNQAIATGDRDQVSRDNAQFCIENVSETAPSGFPVFPAKNIKQTPATGPESLALLLVPAGILGWFLRKFKI